MRLHALPFVVVVGKVYFARPFRIILSVFVTGEMGYHDEVFAELNRMSLILLGHRESEVVVLPEIARRLSQRFDFQVDQVPI